jgi:hypothetical protein
MLILHLWANSRKVLPLGNSGMWAGWGRGIAVPFNNSAMASGSDEVGPNCLRGSQFASFRVGRGDHVPAIILRGVLSSHKVIRDFKALAEYNLLPSNW